jgi:hypothetical protein
MDARAAACLGQIAGEVEGAVGAESRVFRGEGVTVRMAVAVMAGFEARDAVTSTSARSAVR